MTISPTQQAQVENRIRAAMDRLLRGEIPPGGGCDVKTLAAEAGISRAALYRTYAHFKGEFEHRRERLRQEGEQPDPRAAQIARLKDDNARLRQRLTQQAAHISELAELKTTLISRLAAQHTEILRLRQAVTEVGVLRRLPQR